MKRITILAAVLLLVASAIYPIDDDGDGRADRLLILEHSDLLA